MDSSIVSNYSNKALENLATTQESKDTSEDQWETSSDSTSSQSSEASIQPTAATLPEARQILYNLQDADFRIPPVGQPYSIPDPHQWAGISKWKWSNMLRRRPISSLRPGSCFPDCATRPVLLTLDAFDTLFTPAEPVAKQYCDVAREYGFEFAEDDVAQSFKRAFKVMNQRFPNYGKDTDMHYSVWWTRLIHNTLTPLLPPNPPHNLPRDLTTTLYTRFSTSAAYTLFPDVLPFLTHLGSSSFSATTWAPRRTMLGVVSNSDPRVHSILSSLGLPISPSLFPPRYTPHSRRLGRAPDFGPAHPAFATLSYEAGAAKPDRRIFDAAVRDAQAALDILHPVARLSRTGAALLGDVRAQFHFMHVGDDVEKDVLPALECGWDAVLLDRGAVEAVGVRVVGGREITVINSLHSLRGILTKERLERDGGQKPVWIDEETKGPVVRQRTVGKQLRGRRLVEHPLSEGALGLNLKMLK